MPYYSFPKPLLRNARTKAGLLQKEAAEKFKLSLSTWSKLEGGQSVNLSFTRIHQLRKFIDSPPAAVSLQCLLPNLKGVYVTVSISSQMLEALNRERAARMRRLPLPAPGSGSV